MTNQDKISLSVQKRTTTGKRVKKLRLKGVVPANISGKIKSPIAIEVAEKELVDVYEKAGETSVVYLRLEGEKEDHPTLIDQVDYNHLTQKITHVSFRQVDLKQKVKAAVKIELIGEMSVGEARAVQIISEIEVEALPTDLPESFQIDLAKFSSVGQEFKVADLEFDRSKVELVEAADDLVLLQIQAQELMAESEPETPQTEVTEQSSPTQEGEAPAAANPPAAEKSEDK